MSGETQHVAIEIPSAQQTSAKRKKSVCERAADLASPLFSVASRLRNSHQRIRKYICSSKRAKTVKQQEPKTEKPEAGIDPSAFVQTLQSTKKDKDLIVLFKKLPADLREGFSLAGTAAEQADAIRTWLETVPQERLARITELDLSGSNLFSIPEQIRKFTGLTALNLSNNNIRDISPLLPLSNLKRLLLPNNEISDITSLLPLSELTYISLYSNRIQPREGMLELFPERVRESVVLHLQNQNLRGKVSIPESWRRGSLFSLPSELIGKISESLSFSDASSPISKYWHQEYLGKCEAFLAECQSHPNLQRLIDPLITNPIEAVKRLNSKLAELGIPFNWDATLLEQSIKDRSLILLFKTLPHELRNSVELKNASQIRVWMEKHAEELSQLTQLNLSGASLLTIPDEIKYFKGLTDLNLRDTDIDDIAVLSSLVNLNRLDLSRNQIQQIDALGTLVNLTRLNLTQNQIQQIDALGTLVNLTWLNLTQNQIQQIDALGTLVNLNWLSLSQNQIQQIGALGTLVNLARLDLSENQIQQIGALGTLVNLISLELYENQIQQIGALGTLVNLNWLNLSQNQIQQIDALGTLVNLVRLELSKNQIQQIDALGTLVNLTDLNLSRNQIQQIDVLGTLVNLTALNLWGNQIQQIGALGTLVNLISLDLSQNQIQQIEALGTLVNLAGLYLSQNQIQKIEALRMLSTLPRYINNRFYVHGLDEQNPPLSSTEQKSASSLASARTTASSASSQTGDDTVTMEDDSTRQ